MSIVFISCLFFVDLGSCCRFFPRIGSFFLSVLEFLLLSCCCGCPIVWLDFLKLMRVRLIFRRVCIRQLLSILSLDFNLGKVGRMLSGDFFLVRASSRFSWIESFLIEDSSEVATECGRL